MIDDFLSLYGVRASIKRLSENLVLDPTESRVSFSFRAGEARGGRRRKDPKKRAHTLPLPRPDEKFFSGIGLHISYYYYYYFYRYNNKLRSCSTKNRFLESVPPRATRYPYALLASGSIGYRKYHTEIVPDGDGHRAVNS